ncbi:ATP-binding protein [Treponema sp.]|uniref:ATP-binding protein n=1 Tax=Treponema sp. TaxID=166 RepID=UPI00298E5256|nr:ATP-binding protein [Treponema sp.]MCQ2242430.1 ATP-binding protein [Treponema sp.]
MTLKSIIENNRLSMSEAARLIGVDKSQIVKVCNHNYPHWEEKEIEYIETLRKAGYSNTIPHGISIDTDVLVYTPSVSNFQNLADDLSDPEGTMSSSIGMAIGTAERGKTHASKWYVQQNPNSAYILYVDGSTKVQLLRDICEALAHTRPYSFGHCIATLEETCKYNRHLIIIDEADKMPVQQLEMLRAINERCNLPIMLVGEEGLKTKTDRVPRLRSRIRQPICLFEKAKSVDVMAYYHEAAGLDIDQHTAERLVRHAGYGFRSIVNDSIALSKMSKASAIDTITEKMLDELSA